jgi:nucleoside-diphosphate-sugar epimerase
MNSFRATDKAVLVTGANGFIGRHLVRALRAAGHLVFTHSRGERDIANCRLNFEGVGHVFHLAAQTFVPDSWSGPLGFYEVNVLGTVNVLEFCRSWEASLTLLSSYVYGRPAHLPISENEPLQAFNPYSHTKILAEEIGRYYEQQFGRVSQLFAHSTSMDPGRIADSWYQPFSCKPSIQERQQSLWPICVPDETISLSLIW